jgi:hypothetical protein
MDALGALHLWAVFRGLGQDVEEEVKRAKRANQVWRAASRGIVSVDSSSGGTGSSAQHAFKQLLDCHAKMRQVSQGGFDAHASLHVSHGLITFFLSASYVLTGM